MTLNCFKITVVQYCRNWTQPFANHTHLKEENIHTFILKVSMIHKCVWTFLPFCDGHSNWVKQSEMTGEVQHTSPEWSLSFHWKVKLRYFNTISWPFVTSELVDNLYDRTFMLECFRIHVWNVWIFYNNINGMHFEKKEKDKGFIFNSCWL